MTSEHLVDLRQLGAFKPPYRRVLKHFFGDGREAVRTHHDLLVLYLEGHFDARLDLVCSWH